MTERENILRMFEGKKPNWLPLGPKAMYSVAGKLLADIERPHSAEGTDWYGVHWLPQKALGRIITHPDVRQNPVLSDITKWREQVHFPRLDDLDWDRFKRAADEDAKNADGLFTYIRFENCIWERLTLLMGFENALAALLEEPEACQEFSEAQADFRIEFHDRLLDLYPYDLAIYMEDLGSAGGPLMSVDTYREIFKKPAKRVLDHIRSRGVHVGFHSCGKMEAFVGDLVDMGVELINPFQVWNDQKRLLKEYGDKVIFYGGMNNQQITEIAYPKEEEVRKEVRRVVDELAPSGRLIVEMGTRNGAENGVDVPGIMYDEFEKYGKKLYHP